MIKKILIIDDSPIARKMLKSCMPKDQEFEYHEAGDGQEGLDKYKEINPDVTFMDLTMPVMTGDESIGKIINYDRNAVIIVVTADIQMKQIMKVMELGACLVLKKPVKKDDILTALSDVDELLNRVI